MGKGTGAAWHMLHGRHVELVLRLGLGSGSGFMLLLLHIIAYSAPQHWVHLQDFETL